MAAIVPLTNDVAQKSMDVLWERANVISDNIANAQTPSYKQKQVSFEDELSAAVSDGSLSAGELNAVSPRLVTVEGQSSANGNSVDLENQVVELTRDELQYSYMRSAVSENFTMLRAAASEGKS